MYLNNTSGLGQGLWSAVLSRAAKFGIITQQGQKIVCRDFITMLKYRQLTTLL